MDTMTAADPLDTPIGDIDLDYPILTAGFKKCVIKGANVQRNKKETGDNLVLPIKTSETYVTEKGDDVPPGLGLTFRVSLTPTEKYSVQNIQKNVARLLKAAGMDYKTISVKQVKENPSMLDDKIAVFDVGVRQATAEFPRGNDVKGVVL